MSFPLSAFGVNPDDIRYLHCDAVVRGKGRDRLKYCDLEGRWILSGRSIPYISATFNHLEKLNYAQGPIFDITQPALDAIGMVGWTPEKKKKPPVFEKPPVVEIVEEVASPREIVPYRSAGYGPAHQKRKLSIPDRVSRSPSPVSRGASPTPEFDRYATKYQRKVKRSKTNEKCAPIYIQLDENDDGHCLEPINLTPHQQFQKQVVDFDRSQLKAVRNKKSGGGEESLLGKLMKEIQNFERSKLRQTKIVQKVVQLSPREKLLQEIRNFNNSTLNHVKTRTCPVQTVFDELFITIPTKTCKNEECQTESSPTFQTEATTTDIFSEPDSGVFSDEEFDWALVEEKVTVIRVEETEYFVEEGDENWECYY